MAERERERDVKKEERKERVPLGVCARERNRESGREKSSLTEAGFEQALGTGWCAWVSGTQFPGGPPRETLQGGAALHRITSNGCRIFRD